MPAAAWAAALLGRGGEGRGVGGHRLGGERGEAAAAAAARPRRYRILQTEEDSINLINYISYINSIPILRYLVALKGHEGDYVFDVKFRLSSGFPRAGNPNHRANASAAIKHTKKPWSHGLINGRIPFKETTVKKHLQQQKS